VAAFAALVSAEDAVGSLKTKIAARQGERKLDSFYGSSMCVYVPEGWDIPPECQTRPKMSQSECSAVQNLWATKFAYCCPLYATAYDFDHFSGEGNPHQGAVPEGGYDIHSPAALMAVPRV